MRKLIVSEFITLNGVIQGPNLPDEDTDEGFNHSGWATPYWVDVLTKLKNEESKGPFDMVLGGRAYDIMGAYWQQVEDGDSASEFNRATKYVASRGEVDLAWENSQHLQGDVGKAVTALKQEDGPELQIHGSSDLLQSLLPITGLVNEIRLWIFPVIVGNGKRLFKNGLPAKALDLVYHQMTTKGVTIATYKPNGSVSTGTFALE